MSGLHAVENPFNDGYRCDECGWTGPMNAVAVIRDEVICPVSTCGSHNMEPVVLCTKCRDEVAVNDGLCTSCESESFKRDQVQPVAALVRT